MLMASKLGGKKASRQNVWIIMTNILLKASGRCLNISSMMVPRLNVAKLLYHKQKGHGSQLPTLRQPPFLCLL